MGRQLVGVLGCIAAGSAAALSGAVVAAGAPYNFACCSGLALALCRPAAAFGLVSRSTRAGRAAFVGGVTLGVLFPGFASLVFAAFAATR